MFRTKCMDYDFRRDPKTNRYCVLCQRDLKIGQPHRIICWELDKYQAIHSEDWEQARVEIPPTRAPHLVDSCIQTGLVGMDCARRLGLEWTRTPVA